MSSLLIRNARCIATMNHADPAQGEVLHDACIFVQDNRIAYIGPFGGLSPQAMQAQEVIEASRHLVTPFGEHPPPHVPEPYARHSRRTKR